MKSKIFSKAGIISAAIIVITLIVLVSPDAKGVLFGKQENEPPATEAISGEDTPKTTAVAAGAEEYPAAPSLVFKDGTGKTVDISEQKGKVIFINFWATWCPPCIQEMPSINKLRQQFDEKDILFLMVDVDDNYKKSSRFMQSNGYDLPVYTAVSQVPPEFLSGSIPTTVIINKEGKVVGRHEGGADYMHPEAVKFFKELVGK